MNENINSNTPTFALDQNTIDSYPVLILGENDSFVKADYDMCPICLSKYSPKDTLKMLPYCLHRFHADCIDIWLKSQPNCPICRACPSQKLTNFLI
ncbi:RING-H2 finger protein ATL22 [Bienertia sinuspersici]